MRPQAPRRSGGEQPGDARGRDAGDADAAPRLTNNARAEQVPRPTPGPLGRWAPPLGTAAGHRRWTPPLGAAAERCCRALSLGFAAGLPSPHPLSPRSRRTPAPPPPTPQPQPHQRAAYQPRKSAENWPLLAKIVTFSQVLSHLVECIVDAENISETDIFSGKTSMFPEKKHPENCSAVGVLPWWTAHRKRALFTSKYRHFGSKSALG